VFGLRHFPADRISRFCAEPSSVDAGGRSEIVRLALARFIREETGEGTPSPYNRVKNLIGKVESGIPDLGEAHREHLHNRLRRG